MDKKWKDKTTAQKVIDIISWILLAVWFVFSILDRRTPESEEYIDEIAIGLYCALSAYSYWNVKRIYSYIFIAGAILIAVTTILLVL